MIEEAALRLQWALSYPFPRPQSPFVFIDGETWPLTALDGGFGDWSVTQAGRARRLGDLLGPDRLRVFESGAYHAVAAVGSNAAPAQLRRKFAAHLDDVAIPVIQVEIPGHAVAYANRLAVYGSVPATLAACEGARVRVWATLLNERDYALMNATEDRGEVYDAIAVTAEGAPQAVERPFEAYACLTGRLPLRVSAFPAAGCPWPEGGQWEAQQAAIKALGLEMPVDRFILENTADPQLRRARDAALSKIRL